MKAFKEMFKVSLLLFLLCLVSILLILTVEILIIHSPIDNPQYSNFITLAYQVTFSLVPIFILSGIIGYFSELKTIVSDILNDQQ